MMACNDSIMLECHIYRLLRMFCRSSPCYAQLLDLFHDVTYQTSIGQLLDLITAPVGTFAKECVSSRPEREREGEREMLSHERRKLTRLCC